MKSRASPARASPASAPTRDRAAALAPPACGIDFVDRLAEVHPEAVLQRRFDGRENRAPHLIAPRAARVKPALRLKAAAAPGVVQRLVDPELATFIAAVEIIAEHNRYDAHEQEALRAAAERIGRAAGTVQEARQSMDVVLEAARQRAASAAGLVSKGGSAGAQAAAMDAKDAKGAEGADLKALFDRCNPVRQTTVGVRVVPPGVSAALARIIRQKAKYDEVIRDHPDEFEMFPRILQISGDYVLEEFVGPYPKGAPDCPQYSVGSDTQIRRLAGLCVALSRRQLVYLDFEHNTLLLDGQVRMIDTKKIAPSPVQMVAYAWTFNAARLKEFLADGKEAAFDALVEELKAKAGS